MVHVAAIINLMQSPTEWPCREVKRRLDKHAVLVYALLCAFCCVSNAVENIEARDSPNKRHEQNYGQFHQRTLHEELNERPHGGLPEDAGPGIEQSFGRKVHSQNAGQQAATLSSPTYNRPRLRYSLEYFLLTDDLFTERDYAREEFAKGVRLWDSNLDYMGRVEVALPGKIWGSVCGDGWTVEDATVVCRQLGLDTGNVIAPRKGNFGPGEAVISLSQVSCRGDEASIQDCPALKGDGKTPLPCSKHLRGAGAICGCPLPVAPDVRSRCFVSTKFYSNSLTCTHSCPQKQILVGNQRRTCLYGQQWSGIEPQCAEIQESRSVCLTSSRYRSQCRRPTVRPTSSLREGLPKSLFYSKRSCIASGCCYNASSTPSCYLPADSPCAENPCKNGGRCKDKLGSNSEYECFCAKKFAGPNCQHKRNWRCGRQKIRPRLTSVSQVKVVVGGREARDGSWPWIVQIKLNGTYICAGTLIHRQWVLTAAHCMTAKNATGGRNRNKSWTVSVGRHSVGGKTRGEDIVVSYMVHNNYTNNTVPTNDIALFKLTQPVEVNRYTNILCLPRNRDDYPDPGDKCWVAGWGSMGNDNKMPEKLQQADLPIIANQQCRDKENYDNDYHLVTEDMMCAGYKDGGVDSCDGDSGGPMMCRRDGGTWYVAGIVSWGYACGDPDSPGVYTRVSHYLNWIYSVVYDSGKDPL